MKFAHIADVHLGTRRETPYLYDGFLNFIDYMELHPVDMIFITGDLFDHVPTKEDIMFVDTQLARLPKTDILYVTGECDYLARDSVLWNYEFVSRTYLLNCEDIHNHVPDGERAERNSYAEGIADSLHFAKYNVDVYGICQYSAQNERNDFDTIAECGKVTRHFHLPVQSGSNRILKLMNRSYTREHYLELINYAKERIPDVALTSDIIVGFPGETYEDFQDTLSLIREVKYDSLFTFIYSPRKGTKAAEMPDPISQEEKGKWFRELLEVQGEIGCSSYHDYIGRTLRVLCEGPGRTRDGCLTGKSIQNIIVDFDGDKSLIGSFVDVKITDALNWALIGELVKEN